MDHNDFLSQFGDLSENGSKEGEFLAHCPHHADSNPSLVLQVYPDHIRLTCRAGCKYADILRDVGMQPGDNKNLTGTPDIQTVDARPKSPLGPGHIAALRMYVDEASTNVDPDAMEYARRRFGITSEMAKTLELGSDSPSRSLAFPYRSRRYYLDSRRLTVPFTGFDGVVRGLQGRDIDGRDNPKWSTITNPDGAAWERYAVFANPSSPDTWIVTEGPGDGLAAYAAGFSAVAIRGSALADPGTVAAIADALAGKAVYVAGDGDEAGRNFAQRVGAKALDVPDGADLADLYTQDRDGFPKRLAELIENVATAEPETPAMESTPLETLKRIGKEADGGTDLGRAEFLAGRLDGKLIHVKGPGWYAWTGTHWSNDEDSDTEARRMIHGVCRSLRGELGTSQHGSDILSALACLESTNTITRALTDMRALTSIARRIGDLNADPFLISFLNGTVDLRTGEIREHRPEDHITCVIPHNYVPGAACPEWLAYLNSSQPNDPDMHTFLQRLAGYGITGSTKEECLAFFYGGGRNGKGVYTETVQKLFAPISTTQDGSFWEKTYGGRNGAFVADMHGKRLVFSAEMSANKLDEIFVKDFTGGGEMVANPKYKKPFTFKPNALLIMSGNDKPTVQGTDDGIWRRFRCVPWDESFVGREDKTLKERLLTNEAEGIIAWCVAGAAEWYRHGLNEPERVRQSTDDYREESDPFADWVGENFVADPEGFVSNADIKERGTNAFPKLPGSPQSWPRAIARHVDGAMPGARDNKGKRGVSGVRIIERSQRDELWNGALQ